MKIIGIKANNKDNVATIFHEVKSGDVITIIDKSGAEEELSIHEDIPYGHKIAIKDIENGMDIIKYGESIGAASEDIKRTDYIHVHNLESQRGRGDIESEGIIK